MSSRRQRSAPKVNVSPSVRAGLASIVDGNEDSIRSMLDAAAADDLVEKLIDCMGVSNLNAEMLLANYFSAGMLARYCARLGKSDKGGSATLAERIARDWSKPSFVPPAPVGGGAQRSTVDQDTVPAKRSLALEEVKAKRAKQAAKKEEAAAVEDAAGRAAAAGAAAVAPGVVEATAVQQAAEELVARAVASMLKSV